MLAIRTSAPSPRYGHPAVLGLPLAPEPAGDSAYPLVEPPTAVAAVVGAMLADGEFSGAAGTIRTLPRPGARPELLLLAGTGAGDEAGWRAAGAALCRAAAGEPALVLVLPPDIGPDAIAGLAEGLLLARYRYRLGAPRDSAPKLATVTLVVADPGRFDAVLHRARVLAEATYLARDLTNTPGLDKSPAWFVGRIVRAAARAGTRPPVRLDVREPDRLAAEGFGGILAVGGGSARGPRLLELSWRPRGAGTHVVLIGKGITFDTGGICLKTREGMKLMRKDMGGAAAIVAATLAVARLGLPVRVTALAPLAENMISGTAFRPGDVVRHWGGRTTEVLNTDAEGRVVLADALAYAQRRLDPDIMIDLATLTGANAVALGKRTAALYSPNDDLAAGLASAAQAAGEQVWRMPLVEDYVEHLDSHVADLVNTGDGTAGSISAALFLREFASTARDRWAHLDMSAPAWADSADGELAKGATGWGVRTLVRYLEPGAGGSAG